MKKNYLLAFSILATAISVKAQTPCSTGRYASDTFSNVTTTSNVNFGANTTAGGQSQSLTLDVYEPTGDAETARPLIIWAHGGSFIGGSKTDGDVVALSQAFAKKGYVCASINYRLGLTPFDSVGAVKAVVRAVQDMKASIRYFYKDKLTSNTYKIDTNNIFIGGSSAGAITALHTAYLDKSCEVNYYVNPTDLNTLGGLEGYSGNQCYSSKIKGVINLCGAMGRYGWIEPGDVPFCSMHGTIDGTVKYDRGFAAPLGIQLILLDGSRTLKEQATTIGISNPFYTWYGKDHVPYANGTNAAAYMDTTIKFVRDFLISNLGCADAPLITPNTPSGVVTPYAYTTCSTNVIFDCANSTVGIDDAINLPTFTIYPNPATHYITVETTELNSATTIQIIDLTGKVIKTEKLQSNLQIIDVRNLSEGLYFVKIQSANGLYSVKKITIN